MPWAGDGEHEAFFRGQGFELPGLGERQCHRLFHQHVHAGFERGARLVEMDVGRGGDDDRLQTGNGENLLNRGAGHRHAEIRGNLFRLVALAGMHGHQLGTRMIEQGGHVGARSPPADTNQRAADFPPGSPQAGRLGKLGSGGGVKE